MCLSTETSGIALTNNAFYLQELLNQTMDKELLHLNQDLANGEIGVGNPARLEGEIDTARKISEPKW